MGGTSDITHTKGCHTHMQGYTYIYLQVEKKTAIHNLYIQLYIDILYNYTFVIYFQGRTVSGSIEFYIEE